MIAVGIDLLSMEIWYKFLVCLARMAAMIGSLPIFTSSQAAFRLRLGVSFAITMLLLPGLDISFSDRQLTPVGFGMIILTETLLGLLLGLVIHLIFFAVRFGATVAGYQMGFAAAEILDPQHNQQVPLLAQFQNVLAVLIFLALDAHHIVIRVMVRSYKILPPGHIDFSGNAILFVLRMTGEMFVLGLQLIAPVLAVLMLSMFILGIMSRVFSQLQVFMLSFPVNISLALIVIGLSLSIVVGILEKEFYGLQDRLLQVLQLV